MKITRRIRITHTDRQIMAVRAVAEALTQKGHDVCPLCHSPLPEAITSTEALSLTAEQTDMADEHACRAPQKN